MTGLVSKTASIELCFNARPDINMICATTATVNTAYSCDLNEIDANSDSLTFSDNTSIFNISSSTGIISFTPSSSDVGAHAINISTTDDSGCSNDFGSKIMELAISEASSLSSGSADSGSGGGGGGSSEGGGGGGAAAAIGAGAIPQESIEGEKTQIWSEVEGGSSVSMTINKENIEKNYT